MEHQFRRNSALSLFIGALLATITMVLHPSSGSLEHIDRIKNVLVFSHGLAIFCMPFVGFGAWGVSVLLQAPGRVSFLAFYVFSMGLMAAVIAAAINGLVMPRFVERYFNSGLDVAILKAIIGYGYQFNAVMAYLFMAACVFAVGVWSAMIILTGRLPKWIAYYGLLIVAFGLLGAVTKFNFISVSGFRIFVFGLVSWLILVGGLMWRKEIK